jgi:hypothetical protein
MALLFCHISSGNYQLFRRGKGKQLYVYSKGEGKQISYR